MLARICKEHLHTIDGNVTWYSHYRKQYRRRGGSQKTKNPAIPLLGIDPKEKQEIVIQKLYVIQCS